MFYLNYISYASNTESCSFSEWIHEAVGTLITMALFAGCVPDTVHVYALVWKCIEFSFQIIPLF